MKNVTEEQKNKLAHLPALKKAALCLLVLLAVSLLLSALRGRRKQVELKEGDVLTADITAPYSGTDTYWTDVKRQQARDRAEVIKAPDPALANAQQQALEAWFDTCDAFIMDCVALWEEDAEILEDKYRVNNTPWRELIDESRMEKALLDKGLYPTLSPTVAYTILETYMPVKKVHLIGEDPNMHSFKRAYEDVLLSVLAEGVTESGLSAARAKVKQKMKTTAQPAALKTELAGNLTDIFCTVTVKNDEALTEKNRTEAANAVQPVQITRGQVLLKKGSTVTGEDIARFTALGLISGENEPGHNGAAAALYLVLCWGTYGAYLVLFDKRTLLHPERMARTAAELGTYLVLAFAFSYAPEGLFPALFAALSAARANRKEHALGVLLISALILPVVLCPGNCFGESAVRAMAGAAGGGLMALLVLYLGKEQPPCIAAGLAGGAAVGLITLCALLYQRAGTVELIKAFGLPFAGGIIAGVLASAAELVCMKMGWIGIDD